MELLTEETFLQKVFNTTARITMDHGVHMTSIVRHLFSVFEARKGFSFYGKSEHNGSVVGNTQSVLRSADRADCGLAATEIAPRPMYWLPGELAPPSNKNFLSFFSLSF